MEKQQLKQLVCEAIANRKEDILALGNAIFNEPELGYKEFKTAQKVEDAFKKLGLTYQKELALTGLKARLTGKRSDCTIAILGELDAIICPEHPHADPLTGAAHCCGHNVQIAVMMAVGMGLIDAQAMPFLAGDVVLFAVPAEEYVEIGYRNKLREAGTITYLGGKQELIYLGEFDDIDMAMQMHVTASEGEGYMALSTTSNGFIGKLVTYNGRAAHAAAAPDEGVNALNAAMMGLMGIHAIRDTFKESDHVRFHPIITHGGDLVNVVPSEVKIESYVRAASVDALTVYNQKVNRALQAGAMALDATVTIKDLAGYLPLHNNPGLNQVFRQNAEQLMGTEQVTVSGHMSGSTDTGDLSNIMPVSHPWIGGVRGTLHGKDYTLFDEDLVFIKTAQAIAMSVIDLLYDDGAEAQQILQNTTPLLTKQQYLDFLANVAEQQ